MQHGIDTKVIHFIERFVQHNKLYRIVFIDLIKRSRYDDIIRYLRFSAAAFRADRRKTNDPIQSADEFIRNIKKYLEAPELTREMCYELIDRIIVGGLPKTTGKEREIDIVYKVNIASVLRHKLNK